MIRYNNLYIECVDCGELVDVSQYNGQLEIESGGFVGRDFICQDCIDNNYYTCVECGEIIHESDANFYDGNVYCCNCEPYYNYEIVNNYRESPELIFLGNPTNDRYYGVELEIDNGINRNSLARELGNIYYEKLFMQEDGSLSCDGFEIITHPMSLDYQLNNLDWDNITNMCKEYDFVSHDTDTCGLHVHVSRNSFGDSYSEKELNIAKVILIVSRLWDEFVIFSRRNINNLERWAKKPTNKFYDTDSEFDIISKANDELGNRYTAVNINNRDTIEFRMFRGTLKVNTIKATLLMIDLLIDFVKSNTLQECFNVSFTELFKGNYEELDQYLNEREL